MTSPSIVESSSNNNKNKNDATVVTRTTTQREADDLTNTKRRKEELFGDCALIEIIHLHDCLRGALKVLMSDVDQLATLCCCDDCWNLQTSVTINENETENTVKDTMKDKQIADLERRAASRFKVWNCCMCAFVYMYYVVYDAMHFVGCTYRNCGSFFCCLLL
jgi:hypothetical protein